MLKAALLVMVFFMTFSFSAHAQWLMARIIDGDTFTVWVKCLPPEISELSIRVRGIDTPERGKKAKCEKERRMAEAAARFTETFLKSGEIKLRRLEWDKYGGRALADVEVRGLSLAEAILNRGFGRPYAGGKRTEWCE